MSITKKDFIKIADILNKSINLNCGSMSQQSKEEYKNKYLINSFCDYFETINPLFDRQKFLIASGVYKNE